MHSYYIHLLGVYGGEQVVSLTCVRTLTRFRRFPGRRPVRSSVLDPSAFGLTATDPVSVQSVGGAQQPTES